MNISQARCVLNYGLFLYYRYSVFVPGTNIRFLCKNGLLMIKIIYIFLKY